jgi:molybdopterin-guanine dinucleotide biosynthesis protein A
MAVGLPSEVGGYVMAGGMSSRMGRDKALLELAGKSLVFHAVTKLRRVCADVHISSSRSELEAVAPLVRDLHERCGPLGGMEAALEHSRHDWNLFMPVDMPFLPSAFLQNWVRRTVLDEKKGLRLAIFAVDGVPQPALAMIHQNVVPFVTGAIERKEYKLYPVLEQAGRELAAKQNVPFEVAFSNLPWNEHSTFWTAANDFGPHREAWLATTDAQEAAKHLWFANLNTPEEFAEAQRHADALDT